MKRSSLILLCAYSLLAVSCGNSTPDATSTPVDSVNLNGTAPIEYKNTDPNPDSATNATDRGKDTVANPGLSNSAPDLKGEKK